jgi:hypothetical protein
VELTFYLILTSYLSLALSLIISNSYYFPHVFFLSAFSILFLSASFVRSLKSAPSLEVGETPLKTGLIYAILLSQILYFCGSPPVMQGSNTPMLQTLYGFQGAAIVLCVGAFLFGKKTKWFVLFLVLILGQWLFSSLWILEKLPSPTIDVWVFSQKAAESLLRGENPYSQIYDVRPDQPATPVTNLYSYPPFSLLLSTVFYFLFKDVRYASLFCQLASAGFLYGLCRKVNKSPYVSMLICLLFLFNPRWHYVLQQSWTEPLFMSLLFASLFFFLSRRALLFAVATGLFFSAKQYLLPLALLYPRFFRLRPRTWVLSFITFSAVLLPFLLISPQDFYRNVIQYHLNSPFRPDSLSLSVFTFKNFSWKLPGWMPFAAFLAVLGFGSRRKDLYVFGLTASLAFFAFFWLNKQAFLNYYFFVQGLMVLTLAFMPGREEQHL